ncbi:MAG: hypothetical protein ACKOEM_17470 [Planctomycetia bacterium]
MSSPVCGACRRFITASIAVASLFAPLADASARPGGGGGPRGGGGRSGPSPAQRSAPSNARPMQQPQPGRSLDAGRPGDVGPGPSIGPGPDAGRIGAPGRPAAAAGPRGVEDFIGAKPAAARPAASQARVDSMQAALAGRTQPFTGAWYAEHPNAWRYTHPYADWWVVAGAAGLGSWLGYSIAASSATATSTTTTTADATASASAATAPAAPPADLEWMPLGVFAVAPQGTEQAHIYQQLAVSRKGELKGNSYDAVSDAVQPITGTIDRDSRKATWKVGTGATFETTLDALVTTPSTVTMKAGSTSQTWDLVRMEKPETAKP